MSYCGTLSVSLTAASSPKGRAKRGFAVSARQITICPCIVSNRYVFFIISSEKRECNKKGTISLSVLAEILWDSLVASHLKNAIIIPVLHRGFFRSSVQMTENEVIFMEYLLAIGLAMLAGLLLTRLTKRFNLSLIHI